MKKLYIVGGDGFAREVLMHIKRHSKYGIEFQFGGFLGHGGYGKSVDYKNVQHLYAGEAADYTFKPNDACIIGTGDCALRKIIYHDLKDMGAKLTNFISDDSVTDDSLQLGDGNVIINSLITVNVTLGHGNLLNGQVVFGHDCEIGNFNFFGPRSQALGNVKIGNNNSIGTNALLLPNSKVGNSNKIAPLSAIYKGCKNDSYYLGNPAAKIGSTQ